MMEVKLKSSYVPVRMKNGLNSVGGSQMWFQNKTIRDYGCGAIAAYDVFRYLTRNNSKMLITADSWFQDGYCKDLEYVSKLYFPVLPYLGVNGLSLASGLNKLFRDYDLSYHAKWNSSGYNLFEQIERMLAEDIPVIFSVGPNFPVIWQRHGVTFYQRNLKGILKQAAIVRDHYVTIIGVNDVWITVSSWGEEYVLSISEFRDYVKKYSNYLFSNIVLIEKTDGRT